MLKVLLPNKSTGNGFLLCLGLDSIRIRGAILALLQFDVVGKQTLLFQILHVYFFNINETIYQIHHIRIPLRRSGMNEF